MWAAIGQGASVDSDVARTWEGIVEERRVGILSIITAVADRSQLKDGLTADRAADIVFGLQRPETLDVFVGDRGWSLTEYKRWSYDTLCALLLAPPPDDLELSPTRGLTFDR